MEKLEKEPAILSPRSMPCQWAPTNCKEQLSIRPTLAELHSFSLLHSAFASPKNRNQTQAAD